MTTRRLQVETVSWLIIAVSVLCVTGCGLLSAEIRPVRRLEPWAPTTRDIGGLSLTAEGRWFQGSFVLWDPAVQAGDVRDFLRAVEGLNRARVDSANFYRQHLAQERELRRLEVEPIYRAISGCNDRLVGVVSAPQVATTLLTGFSIRLNSLLDGSTRVTVAVTDGVDVMEGCVFDQRLVACLTPSEHTATREFLALEFSSTSGHLAFSVPITNPNRMGLSQHDKQIDGAAQSSFNELSPATLEGSLLRADLWFNEMDGRLPFYSGKVWIERDGITLHEGLGSYLFDQELQPDISFVSSNWNWDDLDDELAQRRERGEPAICPLNRQ